MRLPTVDEIQIKQQYLIDRKLHSYGYDEIIAYEGQTVFGVKWRYYTLHRVVNNKHDWLKPFGFIKIDQYYVSFDKKEHLAKRAFKTAHKQKTSP